MLEIKATVTNLSNKSKRVTSKHYYANRNLCNLISREFKEQELNTKIKMVQHNLDQKLRDKYSSNCQWHLH